MIRWWLFSGSLLDDGVLMECCSQHADEDQLALRSDLTTVHRVTTSCEDLSLFVLQLPDLKDAEAVQKFFLEEIQLGEELLAQGDYEKGVDHLTNAIAVCGQPQQQTLPPPVFQMLLTKLPSISQRIVSLSEDDIE
uniref:Translocase of outer mitochondrial membrane 20 n=1 Tax=Gasterosteus aculeatus aculeatus TaxID=481459 RepID=A0AAQ4PIH5_GASAC